MTKLTRRESLSKIASLAGLGLAGAALSEANGATSKSGISQKITRYEVIPVRVPMHERVREIFAEVYRKQGIDRDFYDSTLVKLYTDEGLVGSADALLNVSDSLGSVPKAEEICRKLVGRSPWEFLHDDELGGILMAIYDLVGQAAGLSVSRLFSSQPKKRIVQAWWSQCFPPNLMALEAKLGYELGYRLYKVKARPFEDPFEQAAAIQSATGMDMKVWADANGTIGTVDQALAFGEGIGKFPQYVGIESPCQGAKVEDYRALKGLFPLPLAEHIPSDPMPFIREELLGALVVGGPIGKSLMQRALMAEVTGVPIWLQHSIFTGVAQVFQAHQVAAYPGITHGVSITHVIQDDLMVESFEMKNGLYQVPTLPGIGVRFDDNAIERYRRG